ncbi:MAG: hypothetical protein K6E85_04045 [Lachnospiraceae bacterium]|nr:hypothetical protein [Lachnospiraceae bacterium]
MNTIQINDISLSYPEGFHEMSDREKAGLQFFKGQQGTCLSDPEKHILVSIGFRKSAIASLMIDGEKAAREAEKNIREPMKNFGYRMENFSECEIAGQKAYGFRYHYTARDIGMTGEQFLCRQLQAGRS